LEPAILSGFNYFSLFLGSAKILEDEPFVFFEEGAQA
jgi:hypothetical protein